MLMLRKISTNVTFKRNLSNKIAPKYVVEQLNNKSLISVVGEEAPAYLQGLITNDINHLTNNCSSLFAMFLNSKGRVLYDSIIYKIDSKTYFVECDSNLAQSLEKHLRIYKLRRKVEVFLNNYKIHILFNKPYYDEILRNQGQLTQDMEDSDIDLSFCHKNLSIKIFKDPRVSQLGYRILSEEGSDINSELSQLKNLNVDKENVISYKKYRYCLGIGEGSVDLPSGSCFPLESNGDFLHGISFHKGCYVGQELTARTHHTGVTRKRLMPLYFQTCLKEPYPQDLVLDDNKKLGILRGVDGNVGLALVRLELLKTNSKIAVGGVEAVVGKPFWWAVEAPKDKLSLKK